MQFYSATFFTQWVKTRRLLLFVSVVKCVLSGINFSRFDADIHNTYTRNKIRIRDRLQEEEEEKELSKELERIEKVHESGFETKTGYFKADSDASQTAKI